MAEEPTPDGRELIARPDDDDYDLLTYGEVAARLSELIAAERQELETLRGAEPNDPAAIAAQEARIAELTAGRARYDDQAASAAIFNERFGLPPSTRRP